MKDIFSELYKKVMSFFNNEVKEENSKDTACNRLKLVLMQDRAKMEPALMEKMREEMIEVISKYVEIDKDALDLNLEAEGDSFALMLNIPVLRAKTREEIENQEGIIIKDEDEDDDEENIEDTEENDVSDDNKEEESDLDEEKEKEEDSAEDSEDNISEDEENDKSEKTKESTVKNSEEESIVLEEDKTVVKENVTKHSSLKKKSKHQKDDDL